MHPSFSRSMLLLNIHLFLLVFLFSPRAVSFNFLSARCIPSLTCAGFVRPGPSSASLPSCSLTVWISLVHVHSSVFPSASLALPPFSWVISLSYVCPSLCVCVPPLFVSDSFSRKIRDAYLVPLSPTDAAAPSRAVHRWPCRQKPHPPISG